MMSLDFETSGNTDGTHGLSASVLQRPSGEDPLFDSICAALSEELHVLRLEGVNRCFAAKHFNICAFGRFENDCYTPAQAKLREQMSVYHCIDYADMTPIARQTLWLAGRTYYGYTSEEIPYPRHLKVLDAQSRRDAAKALLGRMFLEEASESMIGGTSRRALRNGALIAIAALVASFVGFTLARPQGAQTPARSAYGATYSPAFTNPPAPPATRLTPPGVRLKLSGPALPRDTLPPWWTQLTDQNPSH